MVVFLSRSFVTSTFILGLQGKYLTLQLMQLFHGMGSKFVWHLKLHNCLRAVLHLHLKHFFLCFGYLLHTYSNWNINILLLPSKFLPKSCSQSWKWSSDRLAPSAMEVYICSKKMLIARYLTKKPPKIVRRPVEKCITPLAAE